MVRFDVLSEGERGLLGVGYAPARVLATVEAPPVEAPVGTAPPEDQSELAADLRELLTKVADGLSVRCRVDITEDDETVMGTFAGDDLGLLIVRHGQTIEPLQYLPTAV